MWRDWGNMKSTLYFVPIDLCLFLGARFSSYCVLLRLVRAAEKSSGDGGKSCGDGGGGVGVLLMWRIPGVDWALEIREGMVMRSDDVDEGGSNEVGINLGGMVGEAFDGVCVDEVGIIGETFDEVGVDKNGEDIRAGVGTGVGERVGTGDAVGVGKDIERVIWSGFLGGHHCRSL